MVAAKNVKKNIKPGDIIKAMFEGIMFRAKILENVTNYDYLIFFIDYGNKEVVNVNEIYELPDELLTVSMFNYSIL